MDSRTLLKFRNLEGILNAAGNALSLFRSSSAGPYVSPVVPPEFTTWRDEQRAWQNTCALLDISYHRTDLDLKGPDSMSLLTKVGCNKFGSFPINRAKKIIAASHDGYLIGDGT
jgi:vanillate/3-O-methylgallate O-demethylase